MRLALTVLLFLGVVGRSEGWMSGRPLVRSAGRVAGDSGTALHIFGLGGRGEGSQKPAKSPPSVVAPDFRLAASTGGATLLLFQAGLTPIAVVHLLVTALFAVQTTRVRFLFDSDALEILLTGGDDEAELRKSGENIVVGGENRWSYETFTNWKFFPSESVPILFYFKETQTKPEGQIHFFPVLCNAQQLREECLTRDIPRLAEE